jgi:Fe-S cluster biogenesis protein NfuA
MIKMMVPVPSRAAVEAALAEIFDIVRLDGAELTIRSVDDSGVHLDLSLDGASCAECVMPQAVLQDVVHHTLTRGLGFDLPVAIADPRVAAGHPNEELS